MQTAVALWRSGSAGALHAAAAPLRSLYFDGPAWAGWGFWNGAEAPDVCAALTGVGSGVWRRDPDTCSALLDRQFTAFVVGAAAVGGAVASFMTLVCSLYRWCVLGPVLRACGARR